MQSAQVKINYQDGPWNRGFKPKFVWNNSSSGRYGLALYRSLMPYAYVYDVVTETCSKYMVFVSVTGMINLITSYWVDEKAVVIVAFDATNRELRQYLAEVKHAEKIIETSYGRVFQSGVDSVCTRMTANAYPLRIGNSEYLPLQAGWNAEPTKTIVMLINYNPLCQGNSAFLLPFVGVEICWSKFGVLDDKLSFPTIDMNEPNPKAVRFLVLDIGQLLTNIHPLNPNFKKGPAVQFLLFKFPNDEPVESLTNQMSYSLYGNKMLCWDKEFGGVGGQAA